MKEAYYELIYHSSAIDELNEEAILAILESSRENNEQNQISGCLLFHKHEFLQLLEGEQEAVEALFEKIKQDQRHFNVSILGTSHKAERSFNDWTMAYHNFDGTNSHEAVFIESINNLAELTQKSSHTQEIFWQMVKHLVAKQNV